MDPEFKSAYVNYGFTALRFGLWDEALAVSEAGLQRHPLVAWLFVEAHDVICICDVGVGKLACITLLRLAFHGTSLHFHQASEKPSA